MKRPFLMLLALIFLAPGCKTPLSPALDSSLQTAVMSLELLLANGGAIPVNTLLKSHNVGKSPCPDAFEPIKVSGPEELMGKDWYAEGWPDWIDGPETGKVGEEFTPKFNCDIDDLMPHTEKGSVMFRIEGHTGMQADDADAELEELKDKDNLPFDVQPVELKFELEIGK